MRGGKKQEPDIDNIVQEYLEIMKYAGIGWFDVRQSDETPSVERQSDENPSVERQSDDRLEYLKHVYQTAIRSILVRNDKLIIIPLVTDVRKQRGGNEDDELELELELELVSPPQSVRGEDVGDIPYELFYYTEDDKTNDKTPILAISNFAAFVEETKQEDVQRNMESIYMLQQTIRREAGLQDAEKLQVMLVVTAALHRTGGRRSESRIQGLRAIPWTLLLQMRNLFGDNIVIHVTHFMDPDLEAIPDVTNVLGHEAETQAFNSPGVFMEGYFTNQMIALNGEILHAARTNPMYTNIEFGDPYVFDVTQPDSSKLQGALLSVNAMFCVGGETHWLNRQFKKVGMKHTLKNVLKTHKIVCCGNSAGLINMGLTTSFVVSKLFFGVEEKDDTSDLANADGDRILIPLPTHARTDINKPPDPIDYSGLEVRKIAFFPHYHKEWNETIDRCVEFHSDGNLDPPLGHSNVVRLTDGMIIWFGSDETHYLFADPNWQTLISDQNALLDDDLLDHFMGFSQKTWNTAAALRANNGMHDNDDIANFLPISPQRCSVTPNDISWWRHERDRERQQADEWTRWREERRQQEEQQRRQQEEQRRRQQEEQRRRQQEEQRRRQQEEQQRQEERQEEQQRQEERQEEQSGGGVYAANVAAVGVLALATAASAFIR